MTGGPDETATATPAPRAAAGRPAFLRESSYRRRRLSDALRLMPVVAVILFLLPVLWSHGDAGARTSVATIYVFAAWIALIALGAVLTRAIGRGGDPDEPAETGAEPPE